ncbi:MAG: hypothetical protein MHM6MM_006253 [Cercozoa sp. M6MM]
MGGHMAHNLLKAGFQVTAFDLSDPALRLAEERGASIASSPKEAASKADVVVTMLPSSPHVKSVYGDSEGVLAGAKSNALLIDSSTIDPATAQAVAKEATSIGCRMIDAPVSGGVTGAEQGTLTFMCGGSEADFAAAEPVLSPMGKNIVLCGASGMGQTAKICNNLILAISMFGVSEAFNLATHLGMDAKALQQIVSTSSGYCWSNNVYNPVPGVIEGIPPSNDYKGGFGADLMKKDIGLALDAAQHSDSAMFLAPAVHAVYERMSQEGLGHRDFASVYEFLQQRLHMPPQQLAQLHESTRVQVLSHDDDKTE